MRELKFRLAYLPENKVLEGKLNQIDNVFEFSGFSTDIDDETMVIMRNTELHDTNGKEIWEGDIVTFSYEIGEHDRRKHTEIVNYSAENACFMFGYDICMLDSSRIRKLTVIGNIYENPELLEKPQ